LKKNTTMTANKISRRSFIMKSTLVATGAGLAMKSFALPNILTGKQKKVGVALVGLGYYSTDLLAPALQETETANLAGIVTGTPSKEETWMKQYNIPRKNVYNYENFDEIADNPDLEHCSEISARFADICLTGKLNTISLKMTPICRNRNS